MHVALIADTDWLDEDLSVFRHLVDGLIDEHVQVAEVMPEQVAGQQACSLGQMVAWRDSRWSLARARRLTRLADPLDRLGVDLIHAVSGRVWIGSVRLAAQLQTPVVLGLSSASDLSLMKKIRRIGGDRPVAFAATCEPLAARVRQNLPPAWQVQVVPGGVRVPDTPNPPPRDRQALCAVITGTGMEVANAEALLEGIGQVVALYPQVQFFVEAPDADQHELWQAAARLGLLSNLSMLPNRLGHREMLMHSHLLIHPQATGCYRSLTLEAMAYGIPVIAREDPWLDYLIHDQTAWLAGEADAGVWAKRIRRVIEDPTGTQALTDRARAWVRGHHQVDRFVDTTLALYQRLQGKSIKFPSPPQGRP